MKKIILASYGYYPHFWGGSEVYVHGLAKYLQAQGYEVTVVAGLEEKHLAHCEVFYEDGYLRAGHYTFEGIAVIGCTNRVTTSEIYGRYNPAWKTSWVNMFRQYNGGDLAADLLHFHAYSSLINASLAEAARELFPGIGILYSYHVPESCPKGTLVRYNRNLCTIRPNRSDCTACVLQDRLGVPPALAVFLGKTMPILPLPEKTPALLRAKWLTGLSIAGFDRMTGQVDHWFVFSNQIMDVLKRQGVPAEKATLLRHGIDDRFFDETSPTGQGQQRPEGPAVFVFAGRFKKIKGIGTLLKAWVQLEDDPAARRLVLIGGDKDSAPAPADVLEKAKKRKDIEWAGLLPVEEVRGRLEQAHCMIVPSEWVEIGPLVIHEAIACGANVITVDIGGCAELAAYYGENCTTYPMGDAVSLADKIRNFRYRPVEMKVTSMKEHYSQLLSAVTAVSRNKWRTSGVALPAPAAAS